MIRRAAAIAIFLGACTQAQPAASDWPTDADIAELRTDCRPDGTTPEMRSCLGLDLAYEQRRMDAYIDAAIRRESREEDEARRAEKLEEIAHTQAMWRAYAESRCEPSEREVAEGGTILSLLVTDCWILATRQRTRDIWADYLTFWDTTPPIYPEPLDQAPAELPEPLWPY